MADLPVRKLTLYKHGVGFFQREGAFEGEALDLNFRQEAINDVLKSLAAFDRGGGQVLGIHYQTPMDKAARLAETSIRLQPDKALRDLLRDLRGRRVTLLLTSGEAIGLLLGYDQLDEDEAFNQTPVSLLEETTNQVLTYRLGDLHGLRLLDERAARDLSFFLETDLSEDVRRTITLRLSPGSHALIIYYVAPSPTWRVSYRVVAERDAESGGGRLLLQGWGLFDNRLDEDLQDVAVTLVAGQPISFIYDLYASKIPQRPTVQDEARVAPGPVEFRGAPVAQAAPLPGGGRRERAMLASADAFAEADMLMAGAAMPAPAAPPSLDEMEEAFATAAEGVEAGEFFQYVVSAPVSVKRGDSALVPILNAGLGYDRELLYNGAKLPKYPVAAVRFRNETGLTLERGPVTLVEDGEYKGEAVVPFTRDGSEVYLAYAVELGVEVSEHTQSRREIAGIGIDGAYLRIDEYLIYEITYTLENTTNRPLTVTIEALVRPDYEPFDTAEPDVTTLKERRWRVDVPAGDKATFTRRERVRTFRHDEIRRLNLRLLQSYLQDRWLDQHTFNRLSEILNEIGKIQEAQRQINKLNSEQQSIYERQNQLRQNITALGTGGEEGSFRVRLMRQLEGTENRIGAIEQEVGRLQGQIAASEARVQQFIEKLARESR